MYYIYNLVVTLKLIEKLVELKRLPHSSLISELGLKQYIFSFGSSLHECMILEFHKLTLCTCLKINYPNLVYTGTNLVTFLIKIL